LLGLLLVGCEPTQTQEIHTVQDTQQTIAKNDEAVSLLTDILSFSMPSPLETLNLVEKLDKNKTIFKQQNLLPIKDLTHLTPEQLSFLYGQYAVNILYAYLFKEMELIGKYQTQQKAIEQKLGIQDLIPHKDLNRLLNSKNNLDSINNTAQSIFEKIAFQQAEKQTTHYTINILAGGFIEATYLLSMLYEQIPDEKLKEKIGEQKIILEQLYLVCEMYRNKLFYYQDFLELRKKYEKVEIIIKTTPPNLSKKVEMGVFVDKIILSEIKISPQDFQHLREMTKTLRQKYIQ
jgi:hypothetical protein